VIQRKWTTIDPVFNVTDKALACNTPGTPAVSYIPIEAGQNITAIYWYWLHPVGPMSVWLAACGESCNNVDVNQLNWFKIWHAGLVDGASMGLASSDWYQKTFQHWDNSPDEWPVTIPSTLKAGLYLIRHEILSIHVANKPQFYPECANLNVTGSGTALPPADFYKKIPGVYSMDGEHRLPGLES
jgi:Auxiliary Activity family 9 (formerly GH61)